MSLLLAASPRDLPRSPSPVWSKTWPSAEKAAPLTVDKLTTHFEAVVHRALKELVHSAGDDVRQERDRWLALTTSFGSAARENLSDRKNFFEFVHELGHYLSVEGQEVHHFLPKAHHAALVSHSSGSGKTESLSLLAAALKSGDKPERAVAGLQAITERDIRTIWDDVLRWVVTKAESAPASREQILEELFERIIRQIARRIAVRQPRSAATLQLVTTRQRVLRFDIRTGTPPPTERSSMIDSGHSGSGTKSDLQGGKSVEFYRRPHTCGLRDGICCGRAEAHRPPGTPQDASAPRHQRVCRRESHVAADPALVLHWAVRRARRGKMAHHLPLGRSRGCEGNYAGAMLKGEAL
jgi:hypothetical protein